MFRRRSSSQAGARHVQQYQYQPQPQQQQQQMIMSYENGQWVPQQQQPMYVQHNASYAPHVVSHQMGMANAEKQQPQQGTRSAYMGQDGVLYYYQSQTQPQQQQPLHQAQTQQAQVQHNQQQAQPGHAMNLTPAEVVAKQQRSAAAVGFDKFVDKVKRAFTVDTPPPVVGSAPAPAPVPTPQPQPAQAPQTVTAVAPTGQTLKAQPIHQLPAALQQPHAQQSQQQPAQKAAQPQQQQQAAQEFQQPQQQVAQQQSLQQQQQPPAQQQQPKPLAEQQQQVAQQLQQIQQQQQQLYQEQQALRQRQRAEQEREQTLAFEHQQRQLYQHHQLQQENLKAFQQQQLQLQTSPWAQYELQVQFQQQQHQMYYQQQQQLHELLQQQEVQRYYAAAAAAGSAAGAAVVAPNLAANTTTNASNVAGSTNNNPQQQQQVRYSVSSVMGPDGVYRQVYVPDSQMAVPISPPRPLLDGPSKAKADVGTAIGAHTATPPGIVARSPILPTRPESPPPRATTRPGSPAPGPPPSTLMRPLTNEPVRAPVQVYGAVRRGASLDGGSRAGSRQVSPQRPPLNVQDTQRVVAADELDESFATVSPLSSAVSPMVVAPTSTRAALKALQAAAPLSPNHQVNAWFGTPTKARAPAPPVESAEPAASAAPEVQEVVVAPQYSQPAVAPNHFDDLGLDGSPSASPRGTRRALDAIDREVQLHRELLVNEGSLRSGPVDDDSVPRTIDDLTDNGRVVYEASMRLLFTLDALDGLNASSRIKRKALVNSIMSLQDDILHP